MVGTIQSKVVLAVGGVGLCSPEAWATLIIGDEGCKYICHFNDKKPPNPNRASHCSAYPSLSRAFQSLLLKKMRDVDSFTGCAEDSDVFV